MELIIFDLDGTLLDTIEDLGDSVNEVLRARGLPEHGYAEYCHLIGDGMEMLVRRSLPEAQRDDATVAAVLEEYRAAYGRNWAKKSRPYPGVPELLDTLQSRGVPMAVLSNKPQAFTELCVSQLLPGRPFSPVFGQREGVPRKPDPAAALEIAQIRGADPARTLFVGDTNVDIATGARAGMVPVGVLWGFRDEAELRAAGARHLIAEPAELLALIR